MEEQPALRLEAGEGIVGDHTHGKKRHVTLIFEDDWAAACAALGRSVDPSGRRANVLLSGGDGGALVGTRIRIGSVLIEVRKETAPCGTMEQAAEGLMDALVPDCRGGVWGRVLEGGVLEPGAPLEVVG